MAQRGKLPKTGDKLLPSVSKAVLHTRFSAQGAFPSSQHPPSRKTRGTAWLLAPSSQPLHQLLGPLGYSATGAPQHNKHPASPRSTTAEPGSLPIAPVSSPKHNLSSRQWVRERRGVPLDFGRGTATDAC